MKVPLTHLRELTLHQHTLGSLEQYQRRDVTPHGVLIHGPSGVGLSTIAQVLAGSNILSLIEPQKKDGTINHLSGSISVQTIRSLYGRASTKAKQSRFVIIDDVDNMSLGAQNAFLKLLEEPPENIHFILTTHNAARLLPTVLSRVQQIYCQPVSSNSDAQLFDKLRLQDTAKRVQLEFIAPGLPAELTRMVNDNDYFENQKRLTLDARDLIGGDSTTQFILLKKYATDRSAARSLLIRSVELLERNISSGAGDRRQLLHKLSRFLTVAPRLETNVSPRLHLLGLII